MAGRDRVAFAEFVHARSTALHRAAYLMVGDATLAQDLVQEALTKTYVAWPRLRDPSKAEAYTRKAITTTAISWFRRKGWSAERSTADPPDRADHRQPDTADRVALRSQLLDADTVVMIAGRTDKGPVELLTCAASTGVCVVAVSDLGDFSDLESDFQLPVGKPLG